MISPVISLHQVNTAHQLGLPVVATPIAVDGMHAVDGLDVCCLTA